VNARIRVFLTVVSLIFAGLLAMQLVGVLLRPAEPSNATANRQQVDRPGEPAPAANPPRSPSGRSLIRHPVLAAQAG
jgi:hypothetical protein